MLNTWLNLDFKSFIVNMVIFHSKIWILYFRTDFILCDILHLVIHYHQNINHGNFIFFIFIFLITVILKSVYDNSNFSLGFDYLLLFFGLFLLALFVSFVDLFYFCMSLTFWLNSRDCIWSCRDSGWYYLPQKRKKKICNFIF